MCRPSEIVVIPVDGIVTSPPWSLLSSLSVPVLSKKRIVPAAPVINSPWTLPIMSWEVNPMPARVNLAFLPTLAAPIVSMVTTSPTWYPVPSSTITGLEIRSNIFVSLCGDDFQNSWSLCRNQHKYLPFYEIEYIIRREKKNKEKKKGRQKQQKWKRFYYYISIDSVDR